MDALIVIMCEICAYLEHFGPWFIQRGPMQSPLSIGILVSGLLVLGLLVLGLSLNISRQLINFF